MELGMAALLAAAATFRLVIHRGFRVPPRPETGSPADLGLPFRTVSIPTERGRRLFAWHIPPSEQAGHASSHVASSHVVVMHGWGANAEDMLPVAAPLHRAGYGVLLVDARNHGRSDRDSFSSMPRFAEDLAHAFDWLESQPRVARGRIALLGHSVGAAAALLTAARHRNPAAVVALASFQHPELVMRSYLEWRRIPYRPFGWLICRYVERVIGHRFDTIAPTASAARIRCPTLIAHGADDVTTPAGDAAAIAAALPPGCGTLAILPEVGHDTVDRLDAVMTPVLAFLGAHLPVTPSA
jgi:pimeloyl-ACP methyl ester carboxylesterase